MKTVKLYKLVLIAFFLFAAGPVFAVEGNQILKQVDEKLMPESYESYRKLINEEPNGKKKEYTFFSIKKGLDKIAMYYLSPASEKGRATLRLGENMWLYIPNVGKPIRITSMQSITGGVFNNADIMQVDYQSEYNASIAEETKKGYLLELKAKNKTVAYDKLKMWVAKEGLVLEKIECYGGSGMLIKTLEFKEMKDFGEGLARPSVIETHSPLYKGYRSYMIYQKIKSRKFSNEVFSLNYLPKLGELR
ncbi:MAG: outer membrane lipoprotein-sorting protein [Candidatus Margulisiibacteriota bacterium]|nr:MAG: outer membrane lipoprotein-sorting protein [Candidatus Margulisbacteria bacterium GWD2_39_127]OGI02234.1 MAG: outer membrane lipoprotein-sorting protein [Candidatus Margulisbacteria bacterium GWF2_38_17]OGI11468.1 MAG: outer membrane lipoprotein-sorting protein [Candidatus Margulisbacteria bacterium GWE2_39_32]PZM81947.1 MAG: outer membrane lipoprotein-sorting protein [Candidatus Margulisiibacteriota bacterium]HAR63699.1 outer membrane lipoprotein-sorting protein [Candidatus Margulisiib